MWESCEFPGRYRKVVNKLTEEQQKDRPLWVNLCTELLSPKIKSSIRGSVLCQRHKQVLHANLHGSGNSMEAVACFDS